MEVKIIKDDKNELEVQLDNQTVAELVRVYLNKDASVKLGAWKKEHYSKLVTLRIETEGKPAKKALQSAISKARKDLNRYSNELKKAK